MKTVAQVSGGMGSYSAARRWVDVHGSEDLHLLFTDTLCEDQDAYRFLIAGAFDLYGVPLPPGFLPAVEDFPAWEDRENYKGYVLALAFQTMAYLPQMHWLSDGRDVWDVYEDRRFLGNSRVDPCSEILKRERAAKWLLDNCDPAETVVLVGIDYEEIERYEGGAKSPGIRTRMADRGWCSIAPLCDRPFQSEKTRRDMLVARGLWVPRLNLLGFAHNNCGGFCCKGGMGHWALMLRVFPERYAYANFREQKIRGMLGDVSMLTDRRNGEKKPLTLEALRTRELRPDEASDMGACGCFFGDAA
jgi:hypothetical protein